MCGHRNITSLPHDCIYAILSHTPIDRIHPLCGMTNHTTTGGIVYVYTHRCTHREGSARGAIATGDYQPGTASGLIAYAHTSSRPSRRLWLYKQRHRPGIYVSCDVCAMYMHVIDVWCVCVYNRCVCDVYVDVRVCCVLNGHS